MLNSSITTKTCALVRSAVRRQIGRTSGLAQRCKVAGPFAALARLEFLTKALRSLILACNWAELILSPSLLPYPHGRVAAQDQAFVVVFDFAQRRIEEIPLQHALLEEGAYRCRNLPDMAT